MPSTLLSASLAVALAGVVSGVVRSDGYETFPTATQPHPTSAYKMHLEYRTWEQAAPICRAEGGHLLVVNSQAEADIAHALIGRTTVAGKKPKVLDQFHVGMHCEGHIGHWVTVLGGNFADTGWTEWAPNQPSPDSPHPVHCGALLRSMRFNNLACGLHLCRFICEKAVSPPPTSPPTLLPMPLPTAAPTSRPTLRPSKPRPKPIPGSPDVYETFPSAHGPAGSAYKLHRERLPWEIANAVCQSEGAQLVVVNSEDEANVLALIFGRLPPFEPASHRGYDVLHVGITDSHVEGQWLTVDGVAVASCGFDQWRRGEPDNRGGVENCGGFTRDKRLVALECISLNDTFPFVCEQHLNDVVQGRDHFDVRGIRKH